MLQTFFNADIIKQAWPIILAGLGNTVLLSIVVVPLGLFGGLILAMLASVRKPWVRWPLMAWVDFFRAFPPLVLLIFFYAGLPFVGLELGGFACVCIAFFLNTGAYYGEILRASIDSVPAGQTEAARSTGLGRLQTMLYVVLPQAVRNALPDLLSNTLEVVKLTALGCVIAGSKAALESKYFNCRPPFTSWGLLKAPVRQHLAPPLSACVEDAATLRALSQRGTSTLPYRPRDASSKKVLRDRGLLGQR